MIAGRRLQTTTANIRINLTRRTIIQSLRRRQSMLPLLYYLLLMQLNSVPIRSKILTNLYKIYAIRILSAMASLGIITIDLYCNIAIDISLMYQFIQFFKLFRLWSVGRRVYISILLSDFLSSSLQKNTSNYNIRYLLIDKRDCNYQHI